MTKNNFKQDKNGKFAGSYPSPKSPLTPEDLTLPVGTAPQGTVSLDPSTDVTEQYAVYESLKKVPVNGCGICGEMERSHGQRYKEGHGLHRYQVPTDEQRKARFTGSPADHNETTLASYNAKIEAYVAGTPQEVTDSVKTWIDASVEGLPADARILEIGSAFGRDADYMETLGYQVDRTDASTGFVDLLTSQGKNARLFNALTDEYPAGSDLVFADAVLLHFTREETADVLTKIHASLNEGGRFAFTLKKGTGEEFSSEKLDSPRFFTYWDENEMKRLATESGFTRVESTNHDGPLWMHLIAYK